MNKVANYNKTIFENIKHFDEEGNEYWYARELQTVLEYKEWRNFLATIKKAMESCETSNNEVKDHFVNINKLVSIGSNTKRNITDYILSRFACLLIVQNGDPKKEVIALGQQYFAIQVRRMQIIDNDYESLSEEEKRLYNRKIVKEENKNLNHTASIAGVTRRRFGEFTDAGYKGLYNGETVNDIAKRKGLRYREEILDNMCSEELAANIFRISQTDAKLKRDKVNNLNDAIDTHYNVGMTVRKAIKDMGGTMPEELPTPKKSLKEIENKKKENS